MSQITDKGRAAVREIAARNQVSEATVMALLHALQRGHGTAAQFNIDELGGMGQWSRGGMTQVGDMFNDGLKRKVGEICAELSKLLDGREAFDEANEPQEHSPDGSAKPKGGGTHWWPDELGSPSSTGGQNDAQYALFPGKRRLAVKQGERVSVYDSGEHDISGFSQAQGGRGADADVFKPAWAGEHRGFEEGGVGRRGAPPPRPRLGHSPRPRSLERAPSDGVWGYAPAGVEGAEPPALPS